MDNTLKKQNTIVDSNNKSALKEDFVGKLDDSEFFGFGVTLEKNQEDRFMSKKGTQVYCCIMCCMQSGAGSISE